MAALALIPVAAAGGALLLGGNRNHPMVEAGMRAYQAHDYSGAIEAFEEASQELRGPEVAFNLADALFKDHKSREALESYVATIQSEDPKLQAPAFFNAGDVLLVRGDFCGAAMAYRRALRIDSTLAPARHNLEMILRRGKCAETPVRAESRCEGIDRVLGRCEGVEEPDDDDASAEPEPGTTGRNTLASIDRKDRVAPTPPAPPKKPPEKDW
jgi:tetratricopeptide (TPR) repeat protein